MNKTFIKNLSFLILLAGLGLLSLAPYGGWSCNNPMGPTSGPTPQATPTQQPMIDNWEDANLINMWGGSAGTAIDSYGSAFSSPLGVVPGGSTLPGGSSAYSLHVAGTIIKDGPPNYPYCQILGDLGFPRNLASTFPSYHCIKFSAKSLAPAGTAYRLVVVTPAIITDFGYWSCNFTPVPGSWQAFKVFFPEAGVTGVPKLQQYFGTVKPWLTAKTDAERVDFIVVPKAAVSANFDIYLDDLTFAPDTF
jgi:hypothetical protein